MSKEQGPVGADPLVEEKACLGLFQDELFELLEKYDVQIIAVAGKNKKGTGTSILKIQRLKDVHSKGLQKMLNDILDMGGAIQKQLSKIIRSSIETGEGYDPIR